MSPPGTIDLNADLGEGFPNDARLLALVTSAGVSCGAHAGDPETILATLREAKARGVAVGAHPGFPDREGFGRLEREASAEEVEWLIVSQSEFLADLAGRVGLVLRFVKPHGALYNQAQKDPVVAAGVASAALRLGLPILGQPGSVLASQLAAAGLRFVSEGFPDRRYEPDGRLTPRDRPNALLHDPAEVEAQVVGLVAKGLDTLCIHGDHPDAVRNAETVRAVLDRHGLAARFWGTRGVSLRVIDPGLSTTVQDLGRPGYREFGVSPGGVFDHSSAGLANALLGNSSTAALLEMTLKGGTFEAETPVGLSLAGAPMVATKLGRDGDEHLLAIPLSFSMDVGDRLVVGASARGARTYLGVIGGWQTPSILGSRSDETRLRAGDHVPCVRGAIPVRRPRTAGSMYPPEIDLWVLDGPDVADIDLEVLTGDDGFRVSTESDRAGLRLKGPTYLVRADPNRVSTPVAPGAVQWAGGLPLVLGVACGTMGGYPHVAHVISASMDRLAQARPGDLVRFLRVSPEFSREVDRVATRARRRTEMRIAAAALDGRTVGID